MLEYARLLAPTNLRMARVFPDRNLLYHDKTEMETHFCCSSLAYSSQIERQGKLRRKATADNTS